MKTRDSSYRSAVQHSAVVEDEALAGLQPLHHGVVLGKLAVLDQLLKSSVGFIVGAHVVLRTQQDALEHRRPVHSQDVAIRIHLFQYIFLEGKKNAYTG